MKKETKKTRSHKPVEMAMNTTSKRSTTDPLSVNFAEADMAEAIEHSTPRVRGWAWILLATPPFLLWALFVYSMITSPGVCQGHPNCIDMRGESAKNMDELVHWIFGILTLIPVLYWPYLLSRKKPKK